MATATITVTLNEDAQGITPLHLGEAVAHALAFGTDDALYTYADDEAYTVPLFAFQEAGEFGSWTGGTAIGTITLGAAS